jgi:hypothetical protein
LSNAPYNIDVSVHFYGKTPGGEPIMLDLEDPASLNMASANARVVLGLLGLEPGEEPSGEVSMPEARRAVMRARATFERRVESFTRSDSDTKRPGRVRVVECGVDHEYLARRIDDFERFLNVVVDKGATSIYWA